MEIIKLNLIPSGVNPTCHAKQYDKGRTIRFELFNGLTPYTLQSGDTVTLNLRKPDNTIIEASVTATQGNKYVDLVTTEQMTACFGYNLGCFKIVNGEDDIGTLNFIMAVERDVLADGVPSQSVIEDLDALVAEAVGDDFYTRTETDALLADKADSDDVYNKTETDLIISDYSKAKDNKAINQTPVSTMSGYRMSYEQETGLVYIASDSSSVVKAFPVSNGDKYIIRAYGYDVDSFYIAAIGQGLVSGGQSTPFLQVVLCGGSVYPTDYTNHVVAFEAQADGYLYINQRTSTGVSSYAHKVEKVIVKNESFLIINNGKYTHFSYFGEGLFIAREFTRRGPNNLFQLVHVGIGYVTVNYEYVETKSYMTATTDIIGPFSIDKYGWSGGVWTGGNHSVTVNGVACPTAEQLDLSVVVNNEEVTDNGVYYGDVRITAKNKLYFAQTITGNTFDGATPAILETRVYNLTNTMSVEVYIELLDDVRFSKYYGMQYVNQNVVDIVVPNDDTIISISDFQADYTMVEKQPNIILRYAEGEELQMILRPEGLGSYSHNSGSDGYGLIANYGKTYHTLISGEIINSGKQLYWSGEYKFVV